VRVRVSFVGHNPPGDLAFRAEGARGSLLGNDERRGKRNGCDGMSKRQRFKRRDVHVRWQGQLECQIETSLSFRQPAPPSIRKRGVPFIPETTGFVAELRTSRQLKVDRLIRTFQTDVERRSGFDNLSDLTEIFERPISPRNDRAAKFTDDDN